MNLRRLATSVALLFLGRPLVGRASPPQLGADVAVDQPMRTAPALGDQHASATAWGAGVYLTIWIDRNGSQLYAARSDGRGRLRDDKALVVTQVASVDFPAVAFDGKRFLVTWVTPTGLNDIDGAYLDPATGNVSAPFHIVAKALAQDSQAVAGGLDASGNAFSLVAWQDSTVSPRRIHASLFDGSGALVKDANGVGVGDVALSTNVLLPNKNPIDASPPAVAWNGHGTFLVTWTEATGNGAEVMAATVATSGAVLAPFRVDTNPTKVITVRDAAGNMSMVTVPAIFTQYQTVASDGSGFLVSWSDYRNGGGAGASLFGRLVSAAGAFAAPDFLVAAPAATDAQRAQASFAGGRYLVAWESFDNNVPSTLLYAGRIDAAGNRLDGDGAPITGTTAILGEFRRSTLASDTNKLMLAWDSNPLLPSGGLTGQDIFMTPIDPAAAPRVVAPILVDRANNLQRGHAVATNGSVFLLVWEDDRSFAASGIDLYGLRLDPSGKPLDVDAMGQPKPFVICDQPGDQILPAVAAAPDGGGDFLVAWSDGRGVAPDESSGGMEIFGARVGTMGAPVEPGGFLISTNRMAGRLAPTVAASGSGWLVAWEDWRTRSSVAPTIFAEVWAAPVTAAGTPGAEQRVAGADPMVSPTIACAPAAAWNGTRYFVAYEKPCSQYPVGAITDGSGSAVPSHLYGAWFDASGVVETATRVALAVNPISDEKAVQLAALPGGGLVAVWRASKAGGNDEIRAATLADHAAAPMRLTSLDGSGIGVREAPAIASSPAGAAGGGALVTWIDIAGSGSARPGVVGLRVDSALVPIDAGPFNFVEGAGGGTYRVAAVPDRTIDTLAGAGADVATLPRTTPPATVAALPTGEALVAWSLIENLGGDAVPRMHLRTLGLARRGTACAGRSQCADGICTDRGVCCDTACDGVCRTCTANGCVGVPATDSRCGVGQTGAISCAALSTACRHYGDLAAHGCAAFGQCALAGSFAQCTAFQNVPDGTACGSLACPGGGAASCRSGECECVTPPSPPTLGGWAIGGCSLGRGRSAGPPALLALAGAVLLLRRRRRATSKC